ncbi:PadR family transcriptional regulator [Aestuariimicrobium kwangyangense]|uniref:PadR family transcriptional regulator n=1 Tax=Aestuariimicrobium kwangyangense TaxID=396389 RepID=UPI0003B456D5|nr:PadR family transcriptional regulator [Aestuariimicrobium kwangyangense]
MIELMILGFLAEGPLHGYRLRERMEQLHGHARAISDGTLYPAISRLVAQGLVRSDSAPGRAGAAKRMLSLTEVGRDSLQQRLREADGHDITDGHRFMVVLAFLSLLPEPTERDEVLRRRLQFLSEPAGFFYDGDHPLRADELDDPYRRGILVSARATSRAERAWLTEMLEGSSGRVAP